MELELSNSERLAIEQTPTKLKHWQKNILTEAEFLHDFVQTMVLDQVDTTIEYRAALLPPAFRKRLKNDLEELAQKGYRGRVAFIGPGLTAQEQESLQPRFKLVAERLIEFLKHVEKTPEMIDRLLMPEEDTYWLQLLQNEVAGSHCKVSGCKNFTTKYSAFCALHHYKMMNKS